MKIPSFTKNIAIFFSITLNNLFIFIFIIQNMEPRESRTNGGSFLNIPQNISRIQINIGPNYSPLTPPNDFSTMVLAIEANTGTANFLRERYQKKLFPGRFFVLNCAVSSKPLAGKLATFRHYNKLGQSSSLSHARIGRNGPPGWVYKESQNISDPSNPGEGGIDYVPVVSLDTLIQSIPPNVSIPLLKTDTQGHDLAVIKSSSTQALRRVEKIIAETYVGRNDFSLYNDVENHIDQWVTYMNKASFVLTEKPPSGTREWDASFVRT